jgi:SAM-dependent methyltransferase
MAYANIPRVYWKVKVGIQAVLACLPFGESINYRLQNLKGSHSPPNIRRWIPEQARTIALASRYVPLRDSAVVEIGTGWDPTNTILLFLAGAREIYTYDLQRHLRFEGVQRSLRELGHCIPLISTELRVPESTLESKLKNLDQPTLDEAFSRARIHYRAPADAAATGLPDASIDLVCSYAVLEHVSRETVRALTRESKRILKPQGIAVHAIGLQDHYTSADARLSQIHFLGYPEWQWRLFGKNRIHYQNRLREKQYFEIFESAGASVAAIRHRVEERDVQAAQRMRRTMRIDPQFRGLSDEELAVNYSEIVLSFDNLVASEQLAGLRAGQKSEEKARAAHA